MIESKTALNEVLFRFDDGGAFQGAHVVHMQTITENGSVVAQRALPAKPLTGDEVPEMFAAINTAAVSAVSALTAELNAVKAQLAALQPPAE